MKSPGPLRLYWETIRNLRPVQIYGRALFRIVRPTIDPRPAPPLRGGRGLWVAPARRRQSQSGPGSFNFLNETRQLTDCGWDDPEVTKLWRYNLHYFDDLNAEGAERRAEWHGALIARWIAENPPGTGTGWEPYPTSLRIVNWIKWALAGNALSTAAVHSLAMQARWLARRLEYHLLGNHLFSNAKALVFAGSFFEGSEAGRWLARGSAILDRELPEQILSDGGHFELSPMYHALALEDLLDLVNVARWAGHPPMTDWPDRIHSMRGWLVAMCHPDGEIAFFNDAAFGIAPSPTELDGYAKSLGFPAVAEAAPAVRLLPDSGYVRAEAGLAVALLDVARIGPDYLPGHAHADTLSFELSLDGQRAIVNSGTSIYGVGPERLRQRGTAAHNTVTVEGENSSEVWSGFRVARRARPQGLSVRQNDGGWTIVCAHDGYERLSGHPRHRRTWQFHDWGLIVSDRIEGGHRQALVAFHFHPDTVPSAAPNGLRGVLAVSPKVALNWKVEMGHAVIEPSTWHPEFGISLPSYRLLVTPISGESVVQFSWRED